MPGRQSDNSVRAIATRTALSVEAERGGGTTADGLAVPGWALAMVTGAETRRRIEIPGLDDGQAVCEVCVRTGAETALVSVTLSGVREWTTPTLNAAVRAMIRSSLEGLGGAGFEEPVRLWNFLPGICEPIGEELDRYRVFNIARHRAFGDWFGAAALEDGSLPTASCVGHHGQALAIHAMGAGHASLPVENPRQVPAYGYSRKFGPRPPCFSRAGLVTLCGRRLLLVAGTASVRGEESVHEGSLEEQCRETLVNLAAVVLEGRRVDGNGDDSAGAASVRPLDGLRAIRVYHRREDDLAWLERWIGREMGGCEAVEFVLADVCREELLVEVEVVVDVGRG